MKYIRQTILALIVSLGFMMTTAAPLAFAQSTNLIDGACDVNGANQSSLCSSAKPNGDVNPVGGTEGILKKVVGLVIFAAGFASIVTILIGSFSYIRSGGEANKTTVAKDTIMYAVIGLIVAVFAELILKFVIERI